jgi:Tfp pilus assembly protein PilN
MSDSGINLVSPEVKKSQSKEAQAKRLTVVLVASLAFSLVCFCLSLGCFSFLKSEVEDLYVQKSILEKSVASKLYVGEVMADLEARAQKLNSLYAERISYSNVIVKVSSFLPKGVSLDSLSAGDGFELRGESVSYSALAKFIQESNEALGSEGRDNFPFQSVVLKSADLNSDTGTINFVLFLPLKEEEEQKRE